MSLFSTVESVDTYFSSKYMYIKIKSVHKDILKYFNILCELRADKNFLISKDNVDSLIKIFSLLDNNISRAYEIVSDLKLNNNYNVVKLSNIDNPVYSRYYEHRELISDTIKLIAKIRNIDSSSKNYSEMFKLTSRHIDGVINIFNVINFGRESIDNEKILVKWLEQRYLSNSNFSFMNSYAYSSANVNFVLSHWSDAINIAEYTKDNVGLVFRIICNTNIKINEYYWKEMYELVKLTKEHAPAYLDLMSALYYNSTLLKLDAPNLLKPIELLFNKYDSTFFLHYAFFNKVTKNISTLNDLNIFIDCISKISKLKDPIMINGLINSLDNFCIKIDTIYNLNLVTKIISHNGLASVEILSEFKRNDFSDSPYILFIKKYGLEFLVTVFSYYDNPYEGKYLLDRLFNLRLCQEIPLFDFILRNNIFKTVAILDIYKFLKSLDWIVFESDLRTSYSTKNDRAKLFESLFKILISSSIHIDSRIRKIGYLFYEYYTSKIINTVALNDLFVKDFLKYLLDLEKSKVIGEFDKDDFVIIKDTDEICQIVHLSKEGYFVEPVMISQDIMKKYWLLNEEYLDFRKKFRKGPYVLNSLKRYEETIEWFEISNLVKKGFLIMHTNNAYGGGASKVQGVDYSPINTIFYDVENQGKHSISCFSIHPKYTPGVCIPFGSDQYAVGVVLKSGKIYKSFFRDAKTYNVNEYIRDGGFIVKSIIPVVLTSRFRYNELLPQNWSVGGIFYTEKTPENVLFDIANISKKYGLQLYNINSRTNTHELVFPDEIIKTLKTAA